MAYQSQFRQNGRFASRPLQTPPPDTPLRAEPSSPRTPPPLFREITHPAGTPCQTTMSDEAGPNNAPEQIPDSQRLASLEAQLALLLAALKDSQAATAAAAAAAPQTVALPVQAGNPPVLVVTPAVVTSQFTAPIAPLNSPAGASLSLRSLFPDIEQACIMSVITHELKVSDIYKLDTCVKDSEPTYSLCRRAYKNLNSVLFPLHNFFAILTAHLPARSAATVYFSRYLTHLSTLATEYEWATVLEYHTLFFNRQRNDMIEGSYDSWSASDIGLLLLPALAPPPLRPNTDPHVNTAPVNTPPNPSVSSILNEDAWTFYLRDYSDRNFVSALIHIIRHGANLGFTGDKTCSQTCTNLKSAFSSPAATAALSADIAAQVANGRTAV
ncbi:hypothetical protein B0H13DRAFT_1910887 [Mycena leptocephala]|nr:hypothetical protein B0H13DRAFT_1910887 [Mycena leptocephala]